MSKKHATWLDNAPANIRNDRPLTRSRCGKWMPYITEAIRMSGRACLTRKQLQYYMDLEVVAPPSEDAFANALHNYVKKKYLEKKDGYYSLSSS